MLCCRSLLKNTDFKAGILMLSFPAVIYMAGISCFDRIKYLVSFASIIMYGGGGL